MKKLLTVMAVIVFSCLTQGFTTSTSTSSSQSLVAINFANTNDSSPSRIYFRIYVDGVLEVDMGSSEHGLASVYAPAGSTIKFEMSTTPPNGGPDVTIRDEATNTDLFSQNDPAINYTTFSFTAEDGHEYSIWSHS